MLSPLRSFCALAALLVTVQAFAADKYWRPINSNFHEPANWDPIGVPGTGDRVVLDQFGQGDMVISIATSVDGWLQSDNYFMTATVANGVTLTVGGQDFFLNSGGFIGGTGTLDVNGDFVVQGGGFDAPDVALQIQGDIEINPWPLGGWFTDDCASYELDGFGAGSLLLDLSLSNLTINKQGGYSFTIGAGKTFTCTGDGAYESGYLNGGGTLVFQGDVYIGSGSLGGSCLVDIAGFSNSTVQIDRNNWAMDHVRVNKASASNVATITSTIPDFHFQTAADVFTVQQGIAQLEGPFDFHLNQQTTFIEPSGTLRAPTTNLHVEGNWTNNGGQFDHNFGTVVLSDFRASTWNVAAVETFYNLNMNKPGGYSTTIGTGSVLRVENKMEFSAGYLQGATGLLQVEDSLITHSGHLIGSAPVEVVSSKVSNIILNHTTNFFNAFDILKTNQTDLVYFETQNAFLQTGTASNRLDIRVGTVAFKDYGTQVDWNLLNTHIHAGASLVAPAGNMLFSGHLTETDGDFAHNNGHWSFDHTASRTLDVTNRIDFFDVTLTKPSGYALTIAAGDSLVATNKYLSAQGYLQNASAWLVALDSVVVSASHIRGTAPLHFVGSDPGHYVVNQTGATYSNTVVNKSSGVAVLLSSDLVPLELGETDETVTVEEGTLTFDVPEGTVDLNMGQLTLNPGGVFVSFPGHLTFAGSLTEQGGYFEHNMGHFTFDHTSSRNLGVTEAIRFYDVELDKASGYALTIASGDSLIAENKMLFTRGYLQNAAARVVAEDSLIHTATHLRGTAPIVFAGDNPGHWLVNSTAQLAQNITIHKSDASLAVWAETGLGTLEMGSSDESITVRKGWLRFHNVGTHVDFDFQHLNIETEGTFEAWEGSTSMYGNLTETGGDFLHNGGTWAIEHPYSSTYNVSDRVEFWNLEMNRPSGHACSVSGTDSLVAINRFTSLYGYINGASARIVALDSVEVAGTHLRGTTKLVFAGAADGHWIHNATGGSYYDVFVEKDSGFHVRMRSDNADLTYGLANEDLTVRSGGLSIEQGSGLVNWNVGLTQLEEGVLGLYHGTTYWKDDFTLLGGTVAHNTGTTVLSGSVASAWNLQIDAAFHTVVVDKSAGWSITFSGPGALESAGDLDLVAGYAYSGVFRALADVYVYTTYNGGSNDLLFAGIGAQSFDLTGAESKLEGTIEIDKPFGDVWLQSDLDIEDNFAQLVFTEGHIQYSDPLYHVRFLSGVSTGWTGGSNTSFIDGAALKYGAGSLMVPVGNAGTFAPAGTQSLGAASNGVSIRYWNAAPPVGGIMVPIDHISSCEYWEIQPFTGTVSARVYLTYDTDRCGPITDASQLVVVGNDGVNWNSHGVSTLDSEWLLSAAAPSTYLTFTLASLSTDNPMDGSNLGCATDLNDDGHHDTIDMLILLGNYGCTSSCSADINTDDIVDTIDLLLLLGVFGTPCL